ncbi:MAG: hypothetical protein ACXWVI_01595 [Methyloceanibacter sp.]
MLARTLTVPMLAVAVLALAFAPARASAQDAQICFDAADKVTDGGKLEDAERQAAHEACQRALAATASVVQKYQLQEADFDVTGTRPKN